jgi:hypothetical protein
MEAQAKRDNDVRAGRIAPEPPPKVVHNPYGYPPIGPRE